MVNTQDMTESGRTTIRLGDLRERCKEYKRITGIPTTELIRRLLRKHFDDLADGDLQTKNKAT